MRNFPLRAAAYLQDKLETKGFTLNAGLRLDFSNSQIEWWDFDSYDNNFISNKYNPQRLFTMKQTEGQWQFSPRLGISHPITENSKLFFNYGHFKQMPQYEALFRLDRRPDNTLVRIGDPNLTLARTISYELGFDYLFPENILLQVTAFYRDISDQQNTTQYQSIGGARYTLATSNNYSDIRGFELTIRKSAGSWFNGFINYTYQATSSGNFGAAQLYEDPALQKNYDENTENLYQTRSVPTPNAKANLTFHSPDDFGPKFMEQSILGGWAFNLLLNWSQGGFTTYNPKNVKGVTNNAQFIDYFNGTLRVTKTFLFNKFQVQLFADASNLFNNLRIWNTDDRDYRESLHLPKNKGYDNIPGDDKFGDYREPGVEWQPMEYLGRINFTTVPGPASETGTSPAIYFDASTDKYWQYVNSQWSQVDQAKIDQINKDKAYINMPGASTFWFLNPRQIFFGLRVSFNLD
jgi:outer membrane receptor protein involved in Fe transport